MLLFFHNTWLFSREDFDQIENLHAVDQNHWYTSIYRGYSSYFYKNMGFIFIEWGMKIDISQVAKWNMIIFIPQDLSKSCICRNIFFCHFE